MIALICVFCFAKPIALWEEFLSQPTTKQLVTPTSFACDKTEDQDSANVSAFK
jgi:hypothetical protein